ncbi:hypothetical protein HJG60_008890 [Phyllostomus discolor]|uniref:Uncharacterized protein n=1 Tax=Phyllostomus discolor TaxID=89673 RepID=A0A833YWQ0_9CHIR|nr:hypothetical protein HJG60_008890 [Phyllostomus discolor]
MKRTKMQPVGRKDPRGNAHLPLTVSGLRHTVPLLPRRRGKPLRLPVPPERGFPVAVQDMPKKAVFQRINSALRGETEATSGCGAPEPSCSPPACCEDCSCPSCPFSPSVNPQPVKEKRKQDSAGPAPLLESVGGDTSVHPLSPRKHNPPDPSPPCQSPQAQSPCFLPAVRQG